VSEAIQILPIVEKGQNIAGFAYEAICESILEGKLKPGQRLRENEIAQALGISRTPIREALRRLESQHLLKRHLNGGHYVAIWDKKTLWELATLRGNLESLAISLAITRMNHDDYLYLEDLIEQMDREVKRKDYDKLILLDSQFHHRIWSCSGHVLLQEALSQMTPQVHYFMMITKQGEEETFPEKHQEVIDVLKQGNAAAAMESIQKHILETAKHLIAQLNID